MIITIKDKNTTYLAYTNADGLVDMNPQDMVLEENLGLWKIAGHKGWYAACGRLYVETDLLRYSKGLFDKEITYQSLLSYTVPKMKEILDARGLVKDRCWYNDLLLVSKDKAYIIDGYFCVNEVTDFAVADAREDIIRGSVEFNKDMPIRKRICEAFHSVDAMRGKRHFPALVLDIATGKKECWWSYEDALEKAQGQEGDIKKSKESGSKKVLITQAQFDERFHG